jgi:hypothetical protein
MIPKGFMECPQCRAIFVFHGAKTAQFAGTIAASLPVARSQVREARKALYGDYSEGRSEVSSLIHRARDLNRHRHRWDVDEAYRLDKSSQGFIRDLPGPKTTSWTARNKHDSPPSYDLHEREERIVLASRIMTNMKITNPDYDSAHHLVALVNDFDGAIASIYESVYSGEITAQEALTRVENNHVPPKTRGGAPRPAAVGSAAPPAVLKRPAS